MTCELEICDLMTYANWSDMVTRPSPKFLLNLMFQVGKISCWNIILWMNYFDFSCMHRKHMQSV